MTSQRRTMRRITAMLAGAAIAASGTFAALAPAASATTRHSTTGTERFTITSTSPEGPETFVAAGPVSGRGNDISLNEHEDRVMFADGTVTLTHMRTRDRSHFDP